LHPNVILSQGSQVKSPKIPKIGTFATLEAHKFLGKPLIEVMPKENFSPRRELFNDI
jgi:hypothetical protein